MRIKTKLLCGVAVAVIAGCGLGGVAQAKPTKKDQTQAQIDDLRAQIQFLKDRLDEQASISQKATTDLKQAQADADSAKAQAAASAQAAQMAQAQVIQTIPAEVQTAVNAAKPKTDKLYYKGVSITMGGFAEAASIYRDRDETADISSSFSKIPFANDRASHTNETRFTARQSRYSLLASGDINKDLDAGFYGEFDFQGGAQTANSNQSDSYNPRIRSIYAEMNWKDEGWHLLAGQNWSLVTLNTKGITQRNEAPPPSIDAQYVPGFAWARQPQIRVVKDFNKAFWVAVSLENPQTTIGSATTLSGVTVTQSQAPTNGYFNGTNYSTNTYPDVVGKVAYEGKFMDHAVHLEAFGILRSYTDRITIAPAAGNQALLAGLTAGTNTATNTGGGVGGSIAFTVVPKYLDLQGSIMAGNGIGRYGSAGLPDAVTRPNGSLVGIPETMFLAGATFHATPELDFYAFGGGEYEGQKTYGGGALPLTGYGSGIVANNAGCAIEGNATCSPFTKSITQITGGFWDKFYTGPFGQLRFGIQYSHTDRNTFGDVIGFAPKATENMVFTSFRYYPF